MRYVKNIAVIGRVKAFPSMSAIVIAFSKCLDNGIKVRTDTYKYKFGVIISDKLQIGVSDNRLLIANRVDLRRAGTKFDATNGFIVTDIHTFLKVLYKTRKVIDIDCISRDGIYERFFIGDNIICTTNTKHTYISPYADYDRLISGRSMIWKFVYSTCQRYLSNSKMISFFTYWSNSVEYNVNDVAMQNGMHKDKLYQDVRIKIEIPVNKTTKWKTKNK
jgi:hypothetical protein